MKTQILLFPGQGSQKVVMGQDIYQTFSVAKDFVDRFSSLSGHDMTHLLLHLSKEELDDVGNVQLLITCVNLMVFEVLKSLDLPIAAVAGFSLGEYSALYASGVVDLETLLILLSHRKDAVNYALKTQTEPSCLMAVLGLDSTSLSAFLEEYDQIQKQESRVYIANYNARTQMVLGCAQSQLIPLKAFLTAKGAKRCVPLAVKGAFHTSFMEEAACCFVDKIQNVPLSKPTLPFFSNVYGTQETTISVIRENLVKHLVFPVRWTTIEEEVYRKYPNSNVIECGFGGVLSGLWKQQNPDSVCYRLGSAQQIDSFIESLSDKN